MKQYYKGNSPEWFDLNKYAPLKSYNSKQICYEIELRRLQYEFIDSNKKVDTNNALLDIANIEPKIKLQLLENIIFDSSRTECLFKETINAWNKHIKDTENKPIVNDVVMTMSLLIYDQLLHSNSKFITDSFFPRRNKHVNGLSSYHIKKHYYVPAIALNIYEQALKEHGIYFNREQLDIPKLKQIIEKMALNYNGLHASNSELELMKETFWLDFTLEEEIHFFKKIFHGTVFHDYIPDSSAEILLAAIDINQPDEILIRNLLILVNDKRDLNPKYKNKPLNIIEKNKKNGGIGEIKTIVNQRIIQYLDLHIWNLEQNQECTNSWYISKVFADIPRSHPIPESKMNDTIKPQAKKWLDKEWLFSFYHLDIPPYSEFQD